MPEEYEVTTQSSAWPTTAQRRMQMLDRILLAGLIIASLAVASYILLYIQTQAWQILAIAAGVVAGAACLLPARQQLKRNDLHSAGNWSLAAIVIAFGTGELFSMNNTLFATAGALILILLIGSLVRPRRWGIWLAIAIAYGGYTVAVNRFQPLPRYDIAQIQLLNVFIPLAIGVLGLILFWLIARGYVSYSLRTKLIIAFLATSLVSVGAVALYTNITVRVLLQEHSASQLAKVAQVQSTSIGDLLINEVALLRTVGLDDTLRRQAIASNAGYRGSAADIEATLQAHDREWLAANAANDDTAPLIRSTLDNPVADYLREYRATYPENVEVFVTDRYGALLAATNRTSDYYQADEAWWQAAFNNGRGAIYYALPEYDESSRTYSIDIALPLHDRGGNIAGILRTTLDLATVVNLLANTQIGQTGHAEMLLPTNKFVKTSGTVDASPELMAALSLRPGNISEIVWDGVPSFAAVMPVHSSDPELGKTIDQLNWQIVAHQSRAEILAPAEAQAVIVLSVIGVVALIVIGASLGLSQILVRPVVHLTMAANRVRDGDLTAQAAVETQDEIGTLARTFNSMTAQLRGMMGTLEDRIQARTEQLRASADVGRTAASVLEPDELLRRVVNLITDRFGFYYAAIFILDSGGKYAILREATGKAGQILKERGHLLEVNGQSMVGYAITRRRPRIALDVGEEPVRFANPLLPDTRSEIALPLIVGDKVLGVLDVQSTQEAAFDEASAAVLQSMADQIAVALSNAEQFRQTDAALQRARVLFTASQALSAASDTSEVLTALITHIAPEAGRAGIIRFGPRQADGQLSYVEFTAAWVHPQLGGTALEPIKIGARLSTQQMPLVHHVMPDRPFIVPDGNDPALEPSIRGLMLHFGSQALAALPLTAAEQVFGIVLVGYRSPREFDHDQLQVMLALTGQTAVVLQNLQSAADARAALAQLDVINQRLTSETWNEFMRRRTAEGVRWIGTTDRTQQADLPEVREALSLGQIVTRPLEDLQQLGVAVPIKLRGVPLGALRLIIPKRVWNPELAAALDSIAGHIAQATENARLVEQTQSTAQRERMINEINARVRQSVDLEAILRTAVTELGQSLRAARVTARVGTLTLGGTTTADDGRGVRE